MNRGPMMISFFINIFFILYRSVFLPFITLFALGNYFLTGLFKRHNEATKAILLRKYFEDLGGSYIKIGQILSMRHDLIPEAYCLELSTLLDHARPIQWKRGIRILNKAWKGRTYTFLEDSEPQLIASASFAQVYRGVTRTGEIVAIKLKRPFSKPLLLADIFYLRVLNFFLFLTGEGTRLGLNTVFAEIIEALKSELDYQKEVIVLETFHTLSEGIDNLRTPRVYPEYCNDSVICMEYFEGVWMSEILKSIQEGKYLELAAKHDIYFTLEEISGKLFQILMFQIYEQNFFHADPHPGNIILLKDGQIGMVDFGLVGVFSEEDKNKQLNYLSALSGGDLDLSLEYFVDILEPTPSSKYKEIKQDLRIYLLRWLQANKSNSEKGFEKTSAFLFAKSTDLARKNHFRFPQNIMLYYKAVFILEYVLLELNPNFDTLTLTSEFLKSYQQRKLKKKILKKISYYDQINFVNTILDLSENLSKLLQHKDNGSKKRPPKALEPLLLRISIFVCCILIVLRLTSAFVHSPWIQYIHQFDTRWYVLIGLLFIIAARRYFT